MSRVRQLFAPNIIDPVIPGIDVQLGKKRIIALPLERDLDRVYRIPSSETWTRVTPSIHVSAHGLNKARTSQLWDNIKLTDLYNLVSESLHIITNDIERVDIIENIPYAKVKKFTSPVPLKSLGEGASRLFGLSLALLNAKNGALLIDEIESGLHYSVQSQVWQMVFQVAQRHNIQVFATTHSWDCVKAFQETASSQPDKGLLISLRETQNNKDQVAAVLFDEQELAIATRQQIEVR